MGLITFLINFLIRFSLAEDQKTDIEKFLVEEKSKKTISAIDSQSEDIFLNLTNVNFAGGTSRTRYIQIRGIGETGQYETTPSHSISTFIDEIDTTGILSNWPNFLIQNIDILKGPQNFEFGGFASGGVVKYSLSSPTQKIKSKIKLQTSDWGQHEVGLVNQSNFFSGSIYLVKDPNFYFNDYLKKSTSERNELSTHLKLNLINQNKLNLKSSHIYSFSKNGYDVWSFNRSLKTLSDRPGQDDLILQGHSINLSYSPNPELLLKSITSMTYSKSYYSYDSDWGNNNYWNSVPGWNQNYDYSESFNRSRTKISQAFDLKAEGNLFLSLRASSLREGTLIESKNNNLNYREIKNFYTQESIAFLTEKTLNFSENINFNINLRLEKQNIKFEDKLQNPTLWSSDLKFNLSASEKNNIYVCLQKGFKPPGFNQGSSVPSNYKLFGTEDIYNLEVKWEANRANFKNNISPFFIYRNNQQLVNSLQLDPLNPNTFSYLTTASGSSRILGLENESSFKIKNHLLNFNVGLLDSRFLKHTYESKNFSGRATSHAPLYMLNFTIISQWSKYFSSELNFNSKDSFFYSDNHNEKSKNFTLTNLNLTYKTEDFSITFWGKNIFDIKYGIRGFYFSNEPPAWQNKLYEQLGSPRQWGLSLIYNI